MSSPSYGSPRHVVSKSANDVTEEKMMVQGSPESPRGNVPMSVKIFSRIRKLMPWESKKVSVKRLNSTSIQNKTERATNQYAFAHVFGMKKTNEHVYEKACKPLVKRVLEGYNAVLIAYGQTGSGKTHTLVGKPDQNVTGILLMALSHFLTESSVSSVELSAIEAYGTHVSRIQLYDLFKDVNGDSLNWGQKEGSASFNPTEAIAHKIKSLRDCQKRIDVCLFFFFCLFFVFVFDFFFRLFAIFFVFVEVWQQSSFDLI